MNLAASMALQFFIFPIPKIISLVKDKGSSSSQAFQTIPCYSHDQSHWSALVEVSNLIKNIQASLDIHIPF